MTPKPEIAAMLALKKPECTCNHIHCTYRPHNAAIDLCIATLSNHVIIPDAEFAGIVGALKFTDDYYADMNHAVPSRCREALSIAQKYAQEGKND